MTWLVAGPPVCRVRIGMVSSSAQPTSGPLTQLVLPAFWPCRTLLKVAVAAFSPRARQAIVINETLSLRFNAPTAEGRPGLRRPLIPLFETGMLLVIKVHISANNSLT